MASSDHSTTRLAATVHRTARRTGLEVGRPGRGPLPFAVRRSFRPVGIPTDASGAFWIGLDRVTSFAGFSYRAGGWHPYRSTVDWLMAEGVAGDYEASPLASYYEGFQPRTVSEVVFGPTSRVSPLDRLVAWKISRLWTARLGKLPAMPPVRRPGVQTVSDHVGPIRQHYGQVKIEKLRRLIESISETGYRPHEFSGGVTEGIFLVADERSAAHEFIFIPTEGQHRLGVLSALGHERIPVRPRPSGPTVRVSQLDRWARAWGLAPRDPLPRRVFDFYFDSDGSRQAELWGLR